MLGTGMNVVPKELKYPVSVLISYRTFRSVRYRYSCTEITEVSGIDMKVCTGAGGTDVHIAPNFPMCPVPALISYRSYRGIRYRYWCHTELTEMSGTGIDVLPNVPKCLVPVFMPYRTYRNARYRYWCRTELPEVSGTGIDIVSNLLKCPVPILMLYRTCPGVRYRYWCCTELTKVPGTGMNLCTGIGGTIIDIVINLLKCRMKLLKYRYWCRTELTEVSGTGDTGGIYRRYASVRTVPNAPLQNCQQMQRDQATGCTYFVKRKVSEDTNKLTCSRNGSN